MPRRLPRPRPEKTPKRSGAATEARFVSEVLRRGFDVLDTVGDYLPFDCLVSNRSGRFTRVQVKGSSYRAPKQQHFKVVAATGSATKAPIDPEQVDVLAAYVVPADAWYLIPVDRLASISLHFSPLNPESKAKYEVWRDAWNVFE